MYESEAAHLSEVIIQGGQNFFLSQANFKWKVQSNQSSMKNYSDIQI